MSAPEGPRPASRGDAEAIAAVFRRARRAAMPWLPELHRADEERAFFRDVVLERCEVWVEGGAAPSAFIAFDEAHVEHLYVDPSAQGAGAGTRLLAIAQARRDALELWVFQRNTAARRFYEARGFRLVELTDGAGNEEREPDARYRWERAPLT